MGAAFVVAWIFVRLISRRGLKVVNASEQASFELLLGHWGWTRKLLVPLFEDFLFQQMNLNFVFGP
jgi:hypothetical protein